MRNGEAYEMNRELASDGAFWCLSSGESASKWLGCDSEGTQSFLRAFCRVVASGERGGRKLSGSGVTK